jgi:FkbM family methyltransferase
MIHHLFDDNYSKENCDLIEEMGTEGPYCYENVMVEKRDVVIDAGAYIGDWSCVAAWLGGNVYAFEPSPIYNYILQKCAELNNFKIVTKGLGDIVCDKMIDTTTHATSASINSNKGVPCNLTTIDKFADEQNLHIDFIKADIEGYERNMLTGASQILKEDCPKLAIKTYHIADDYLVLPKMIQNINPDYKIINRKKVLYAYVE